MLFLMLSAMQNLQKGGARSLCSAAVRAPRHEAAVE
jgi:hypothetical protein